VFEMRRHRYTSRFIDAAHEALHGRSIGLLQRHSFAKEYRPVVRELDEIARAKRERPGELADQLRSSVPAIFHELSMILAGRIRAKVERYEKDHRGEPRPNLQDVVGRLEVPADARALFGGADDARPRQGMSGIDLPALSEGLPFPALAALVVGGSAYASAKVQFANRPLLEEFSQAIGRHRHPRRMLWLTDTFSDQNGVAGVLRLMHAEAVRRDLPIDFAVCHATAEPGPHLEVLRPVVEFTVPFYEQQPMRVFDLLQLQRLFLDGGYDRVMCSTEGLMGLAGLFLKSAFSVPAFFFVHTDWIDFARRTLKLDVHNTDRVRRLLRTFYRSFDGLFVLNSDHEEWLASEAMGVPRGRLRPTAHWVDERFVPAVVPRCEVFPGLREKEPVLLFVGRVSEEKGVLELPAVVAEVRRRVPAARLAVVGSGPAEEALRAAVPDAVFVPWVDTERLARIYPAADVLLLPSRFDTFGCVVLEALACGLPVVAYRTKGPKDIIQDGVCGYTVDDVAGMADAVVRILSSGPLRDTLSAAAVARAGIYRADRIVDDLLRDIGLGPAGQPSLCDEPPMPPDAAETGEGLADWSIDALSA
jgi:glycosyltransferase involved in cell wall biosynthesis